jgi:hypothetical protein
LNNLPAVKAAASASPIPDTAAVSPSAATTSGKNGALSAAPAADTSANRGKPEMHVQVEAPLVFNAKGLPPAPMEDVRALPSDSRRVTAPALTGPLPPPAREGQKPNGSEAARSNPAPSHGLFHKLGRFFAAMFH